MLQFTIFAMSNSETLRTLFSGFTPFAFERVNFAEHYKGGTYGFVEADSAAILELIEPHLVVRDKPIQLRDHHGNWKHIDPQSIQAKVDEYIRGLASRIRDLSMSNAVDGPYVQIYKGLPVLNPSATLVDIFSVISTSLGEGKPYHDGNVVRMTQIPRTRQHISHCMFRRLK